MIGTSSALSSGAWVDDFLLSGPDAAPCLRLDRPFDRRKLRSAVLEWRERLVHAGLDGSSSMLVQLPASVAQAAVLLAGLRLGAQVVLVDHRVPEAELNNLDGMFSPRVSVRQLNSEISLSSAEGRYERLTNDALVLITSGSVGAPKAVGRNVSELMKQVDAITTTDGMPGPGDSAVVLGSWAHAYGLLAGLLHCLHAGVELIVPHRPTAQGIFSAVGHGSGATAIMAVPFHVELLNAITAPPHLPRLARVLTSGEALRADTAARFSEKYGVPAGTLYGTTETGLIASDLDGLHRPAVGHAAPGVRVRVEGGELQMAMDSDPYIGPARLAGRWENGWLRTGDRAELGPEGLITLRGRVDTQVTIAGLKVDLAELERLLSEVPSVTGVVVVKDRGLVAYLEASGPEALAPVRRRLLDIPPHQRPRTFHVVPELPRTVTGKLTRDRSRLKAAVSAYTTHEQGRRSEAE
jgi:3-hydroxy-4-methylanthranilate adenylyltransferase